jgi:hypothetical protein
MISHRLQGAHLSIMGVIASRNGPILFSSFKQGTITESSKVGSGSLSLIWAWLVEVKVRFVAPSVGLCRRHGEDRWGQMASVRCSSIQASRSGVPTSRRRSSVS